ncbi:MAG: hypothetical protein ACOYLL_04935 [Beijerinckiaceae bacterium]|jgi:hypothetical protein
MPNRSTGWITRIASAMGGFVAHRDPRMAYGNLIAVMVGSNQPLFPLTLYLVLGDAARPSLWGMISMLFFCAVPLVARSNVSAAKLLLSLYASLHTAAYVLLMGQGAGFELYFLPCILLSALLFPARQRLLGWALCAVPALLFFAVQRLAGQAGQFGAEAVASLWQVNAISVACLTAMMGMLAPAPRDRYPS